LKPGAHVTVLGADGFAEPPLPRALLERAARFCDARAACAAWAGPVHADLGQVLRGEAPGRVDAAQLTFFQSSGPSFLELVAAWHVFQGARHDSRISRVELEG
jgi:ornithine cyclodeaminase